MLMWRRMMMTRHLLRSFSSSASSSKIFCFLRGPGNRLMELPRELDVFPGIHGHHHSSPPPQSSSSREDCGDDPEISLREQFAAALMSIHSKEEIIRQHVKVSEEAVSGWEKAEEEVAFLRDQLEAAARENFSLESRVLELDAAIKQYRRHIRISTEHQEKRFRDMLTKRTDEWRSEKFELENLIIDLAEKLQTAEKIIDSPDNALRIRLRNLEMENEELRLEILSLEEQIEIRTAERDLIRHHLESIVNAQASAPAEEMKSIECDEFQESDDTAEFLEAEVMELQKKMTELEKEIENEAAEKSSMEKRLAETEDKLMVAKRRVEETERMVENLQNELLTARNEVQVAESRAADMQEKVRYFEKKERVRKNVTIWR